MAIWISSLAAAPRLAEKHKVSRVVSLLSPYDTFPTFSCVGPDCHLTVPIHDIAEDIGGWRAPGACPVEAMGPHARARAELPTKDATKDAPLSSP